MFPLFLPGDKVRLVKSQKFSPGDIVAYLDNGLLIAHRIVYLSPGRDRLITKGDNNLRVDAQISSQSVLGKVVGVERGKNFIKLEHLYYTQSAFYLSELARVAKILEKEKINYIILRGIIPHLFFAKAPPQRLFADCDIFVAEKDFGSALKVLSLSGFRKLPATLFGKQFTYPTEITLQKDTLPYPVRLDLHRSLGIPFTKLVHLNKLFPKIKNLEADLAKNTISASVSGYKFPILSREVLFVYTILHWYRHNYEGAARMDLSGELFRTGLNWTKVASICKKYGVVEPVYLGLALAEKYFGWKRSPLKPVLKARLLARFISPFRSGSRFTQGVKRIILVLVLSPRNIFSKLALLLSPRTFAFIPPAFGYLVRPSGVYITHDYASHSLNRGLKTKSRRASESRRSSRT